MDDSERAFQAKRRANTKALEDVLEKQREGSEWHSVHSGRKSCPCMSPGDSRQFQLATARWPRNSCSY